MSVDSATEGPRAMDAIDQTVYRADGLTATLRAGTLQVRLPGVQSNEHYLSTVAGLQQVYDHGPSDVNWVVDGSALCQLPLPLLSLLVCYARGLDQRGQCLTVIGLRPELYPPSHIDTRPLIFADRPTWGSEEDGDP